MEDLFNTQSELQEEQNDIETTDNVVELTDELADQHLSEIGLSDDTEKPKESEKKPKADKLNDYEKIILAEMQRRANGEDGDMPDDNLAVGLASKDKNIHECFEYVKSQARKKAVSGCAMIEDSIVFGWAHHYYIEPKEVIDAELHPKSKTDTKGNTAKIIPMQTKGKEKAKKPSNPKDAGKNNPLLQKVAKGKKKTTPTKTADKVTTKKVNGRVFTITEFSLF